MAVGCERGVWGGERLPFSSRTWWDRTKSRVQDASNLLSPNYPMSAISESYIQTAANNHPPQHHSTPVRQYSRGSTQQPSITAGSGTRSRVQNSRPAPQQIDRFADECEPNGMKFNATIGPGLFPHLPSPNSPIPGVHVHGCGAKSDRPECK